METNDPLMCLFLQRDATQRSFVMLAHPETATFYSQQQGKKKYIKRYRMLTLHTVL